MFGAAVTLASPHREGGGEDARPRAPAPVAVRGGLKRGVAPAVSGADSAGEGELTREEILRKINAVIGLGLPLKRRMGRAVEGTLHYHLMEEEYLEFRQGRGPAWEEEQRRQAGYISRRKQKPEPSRSRSRVCSTGVYVCGQRSRRIVAQTVRLSADFEMQISDRPNVAMNGLDQRTRGSGARVAL